MRREILLNIDVAKAPVFNREFTVRNGDSLRLNVCMFEHGKVLRLDNQVIRAYVRKSDGSLLMQKDDIEIISENEFQVLLKNSATNVSGLCYMELEIQDPEETSVVIATNPILFEVEDRIGDVEKAITAVDDIYIVGELEKFIAQSKLDIELLKTQIAEGLLKIEEFNNFVVEKSELLQNAIDEVVANIDFGAKDYLAKITGLCEEYGFKITSLGEAYLEELKEKEDKLTKLIDTSIEGITVLGNEAIQNISELSENATNLIEDAREEAVHDIHVARDESKEELDSYTDEKLLEISATKNDAIAEMTQAKDNALANMGEKEAEILENIGNLKDGGIEMLEEAIDLAEKRLQAQTVQSLWEVQEKSAEEQDNLEAVSSEEQTNIRLKANEQIERVNEAGEHISNMAANLQGNIDTGLNQINTAISTGKSEINTLSSEKLQRIREEGQEIVDMVAELEMDISDGLSRISSAKDSAVLSVERAGANEASELNSYARERKEEINELSASKLEAIGITADSKLEEIQSILGITKGDAEELLEQTRVELQTHRTEIATRVNVGKEEINTLKNNSIDEMNTRAEELVNEVMNAEINLKNDFTQLAENYKSEINSLGSLKAENLQNMIDAIDELEEAVADRLANSEERAENIRENFNDIFESTDAKMAEIRPVLNDLNEMRSLCNTLINQNKLASENSETLDYLHTESDVRIVELRRLIELAKHYEEVVQRFINERGGNHDEIDARLLALEESLVLVNEALDAIDLSIYATKEELNEAITPLATKEELEAKANEIIEMIPAVEGLASEEYVNEAIKPLATKEELQNVIENVPQEGYKGTIAPSVRVAGDIDGAFNDMPEMPEPVEGCEYIGKIMYSTVSSGDTIYRVVYLYNNPVKNYYPFIYANATTHANGASYAYTFYNTSSSTSTNTARIFEKTNFNGTWSEKSGIAGSFYDYWNTRIYHNDMPIYTDTNKTDIYRESSASEFIGNANNANKEGKYLVDIEKSRYSEVQGLPAIKIAKDLETVLHTYGSGDNAYQEIAIEGVVYTRKIGESWLSQDTSNLIKKNVIANIEGSEAVVYSEVEDIYASCPQPNNHKKVYGQIDFKDRNGKYYRFYNYIKDAMFYRYDNSSNNSTIGMIAPSVSYVERYIYEDGEWKTYSSSYLYVSIGYIGQYEIFYCSTDICKGTSSTAYDKNTIVRKADGSDSIRTINSFDNATYFGFYNVNGVGIGNAPIDTEIKGSLEVIKTEAGITQRLTTTSNEVYIRNYTTAWSEWSYVPDSEKVSVMIDEAIAKDNTFNGVIGAGIKVASIPTGVFDSVPEPPIVEGSEYIGKLMYRYYNSSSKNVYRVDYIYKNKSYDSFLYKNVSSNEAYIYGNYIAGSYKTLSSFEKVEGNTIWSTQASLPAIYVERRTFDLYHHDLPIYDDRDKTAIYREATTSAPISNFDNATEEGEYLVDVSVNDYKTLQNAPKIQLTKDLNTVLTVRKQEKESLQEITIEGMTFTRKTGEEWTTLNTDAFAKANTINTIKAGSSDTYGEYKEIYDECPVPNTHNDLSQYMDFKAGNYGYLYRIYILREHADDMFYYCDYDDTRAYIGSIASGHYTYVYEYKNGAWSMLTSSSSNYVYGLKTNIKVFKNTLPICKATSTSVFDKTTILKEAETGVSQEAYIVDFDKATTTGHYNIDIKQGNEIANSPVMVDIVDEETGETTSITGDLKGILKVVNSGDYIEQIVETSTGETYKRMIGSEWTNNAVDLSNYTTTTAVEEMINAMLGAPKTELINDLNDIIRGI